MSDIETKLCLLRILDFQAELARLLGEVYDMANVNRDAGCGSSTKDGIRSLQERIVRTQNVIEE